MAAYLQVVATKCRDGQMKEWKRKLLRKSTLVLVEVARTGSYRWALSFRRHPNDALDAVFRPVQEEFESWLEGQRLAGDTRELYATVSRTILAWLPERGVTSARALAGSDIAAAVIFLGGRYKPGSMRTAVTAVRVLCRFLEESGRCTGLARAVPRQVSRRVLFADVLPGGDVEALTNSTNTATPQGRRDKAMLLLAARTGLRPVDISGLRLQDIDWAQGQITLAQHKTGALLILPLLADVGKAIADYLLHGRPDGVADEHVFLRSQAPYVGLSPSSGLYNVAAAAFARTTTSPRNGTGHGFRVLRASFATRMLEDDTSLPVISGALGHRGIASAKHYLAADDTHLRDCCLDFAGIEPRTARP
ncbi:tyrosine-type recombinase/integrase [Cryobacterium sp. Hh38]|uniref:tyrosine-type recombinase/integrase n=1 Tax=Cryobacterium sp. Hh38 TaxID=1259156 RepID=UPI00141BF0B6|nr:tyrosine-type recombinase/integrase [Cryobacterium sp. Hh38]